MASANPYFSALKATTTVNVTVGDQFENPVTSGFVAGFRAGPANTDTAPGQIKPVGADGTATFTFTDAKATVGQSDTVQFADVPDQFTQTPDATGTAKIKYTATGQGADFNTSLEGKNTGDAAYKASDVTVVPLADTVADDANEGAALVVTGAEHNQAVTVSVDNGALIVKTGDCPVHGILLQSPPLRTTPASCPATRSSAPSPVSSPSPSRRPTAPRRRSSPSRRRPPVHGAQRHGQRSGRGRGGRFADPSPRSSPTRSATRL